MHEVPVVPRSDDGFSDLVDEDRMRGYQDMLRVVAGRMRGRTLWHINSAAEGGGVAELLRSCLGYLRDGAIDTRWLVFQADRPFFDITKRIHNRLHGDLGDGGPLAARERRHIDAVTARTWTWSADTCGRATSRSCTTHSRSVWYIRSRSSVRP